MSDEISRLKEEARQEQNNPNGTVVNVPPQHVRHNKQRQASSITGPLILILLGFYFLMHNLGYTDLQLNWWVFGRYWPLLLIFAGLNIVTSQLKGGFGTLLRTLISIGAVGLFGALLLFGDALPFVEPHNVNIQTQEINVPRQDIATAAVEIDFANAPATLNGLDDSNDLLAGTVSYINDVNVVSDQADGFAELSLDTDDNGGWLWGFSGPMPAWELGLNTAVPLDLSLSLDNGPTTLDLVELTLTDLYINSGNGRTQITLPSGDYDVDFEGDNGQATITLPAEGSHYINVNGGNGSIHFILPATAMEARITVNDGNGSFTPPEHMRLVSGERNGDGVWETPKFDPDAPNIIDMELDVDNGSVRVEAGSITGR